MASLLLGPLLRHAGERDATVWVETDAPCTVEVLGHRERTFSVAGHHYALVLVEGLEPASITPYEVLLDGDKVWPAGEGRPPSVIRTAAREDTVTVAFGSCRIAAPHESPWTLRKDVDARGREIDALRALGERMSRTDPRTWPHALVMLGDQIYADEVAPATCEFIRSRRDPSVPPGETLADFEEYTRLYRESWSDPPIRWVLSTVPTAMIFDDHDVHDDWNTSLQWVERMRAQGWWDERIVGGFMSYWLYQHLGNLQPAALATDATYLAVRAAAADGEDILRDFAWRADRSVETAQWSFVRDIGPARLVMIDSRAGRVLDPGARSMVDEREWEFIAHSAADSDHRHLLLGTSLPWLLARGMHDLEAWDEALCDGAWGGFGRRLGERLRQGFDLEHWAAFRGSFERLCGLVREIGDGRHGPAPATIVALSGDVHHAYLAEVSLANGAARSHIYQAVCSPFRNPLARRERAAIRFATGRGGALIGRVLARSARVPQPPLSWRFAHRRPWFDNMVALLELADGGDAKLRIERAVPGATGELELEAVYDRDL